MTNIRTISSDNRLDDIERPFRVRAGPGAGKTFWLAGHIVDVLRRSERLHSAAKIACISYTNIAVDQLTRAVSTRLGKTTTRLEATTIHSFLYHTVVKPYLHLLRDAGNGEALVAYELVDGHDEHRPAYDKVDAWLGVCGRMRLAAFQDADAVFAYLRKVTWERNEEGAWHLTGRGNPPSYLPTNKLDLYKPFYWADGTIDHDDVLFLAHRILDENPLLRRMLACRYPYLFLDEFQDTNPVQADVVQWLADAGCVVGVVGDPQQSIFGFQNAKQEHFDAFSVPSLDDYQIAGNRRSTDAIIEVLNLTRMDDLVQKGVREEQGEPVVVLVGTVDAAINWVRSRHGESNPLAILTWTNDDARRIRRESDTGNDDVWRDLWNADRKRAYFLQHLCEGITLLGERRYNRAIASFVKAVRVKRGQLEDPWKSTRQIDVLERRGMALLLLSWHATHLEDQRARPLLEAYESLNEFLASSLDGVQLKKVAAGRFKEFANTVTLDELLKTVTMTDEARLVRTIHKAKGDEFPSVVVHFESPSRLDHVLHSPSSKSTESQRVTYVALSRAGDHLYISTSSLTPEQEQRISKSGSLSLVRLDQEQPLDNHVNTKTPNRGMRG